jgi:hypothetical protein
MGAVLQPERRERPVDPVLPQTRDGESQRSRLALELATRPGVSRWMDVYGYVYQFANFDPCRSKYRSDFVSAGVSRLFSVQETGKLNLDEILGCNVPKLRLVAGARVVNTAQEARQALLMSRPPRTVIRLAEGATPPGQAAGATGATPGSVEVTSFSLNELVASTQVSAPDGAWLVYADAYHPGWRASVNGQETPVEEANLAFKAVWLPPGPSIVRFWFDHGPSRVLGYAIACFGVAFALGLLAMLLAALWGAQALRKGPSGSMR